MKTESTNNPVKKKRFKKLRLLWLIPIIIVTLLIAVVIKFRLDANIPYEVSTEGVEIPTYDTIELDFEHQYNSKKSIQVLGAAIIDLDNKGAEELFIGGGKGQEDVLYRFEDGAFKDITSEANLSKGTEEATLSSVSLDIDNDGDDDLIISRSFGIWIYTNDGGKLTGKKLELPLHEDTSPISVAVCDLNNDGHFDMYVCGYLQKEKIEGLNIFNQKDYGGLSQLFVNNGDNTFTDHTESSGLNYKHNTFQAVFSDVDQDGNADLVVAHDTGQVRTYRNLGGVKFEMVENPNTACYSYPMGIAVSDYDNDGKVDFFFSNTGSTVPDLLARGDLRDDQTYNPKWLMFHNDGDFKFTDTAEKVKLANYEFSWGAVFEDFNLDGRPDLAVSENFVDMPVHKFSFLRLPCRFLIQNTDGEFAAVGKEAGVVNKAFSISPLTADFNLDGAPDLVHANIAGKSKVFLSKSTNPNFVKVKLPNNAKSVGAMVKATLSDGRILYRPFVKAEGLCADSTVIITIGTLDADVTSIEATFLNGTKATADAPAKGSTVILAN